MTEAQYIREQLEVLVGTYEGMDGGQGDPVHAVRERARELLESGSEPTRSAFLEIADMLAAALPMDQRAVGMHMYWEGALDALVEANKPCPPDPARWKREASPGPQDKYCGTCQKVTNQVPFTDKEHPPGQNYVVYFCPVCWNGSAL